jgi:hypothetical protein
MRIVSFATLGSLALLLAASAFGQEKVTADIPFEFQVGNVIMPAGHYEIRQVYGDNQGLLHIVGDAGQVIFFTNGAQNKHAQFDDQLVFNKYGDKYFLSQVITSWWDRKLIESRREHEVARKTSPGVDRIVLAQR